MENNNQENTKIKRWILKHKKAGVAALNRSGHHSIACISWKVDAKVEVRSSDSKEISYSNRHLHGTVTISDCGRVINLDFDCYKKKERINTLHKIDTIMQELTKFRKHLIKGMKVMKEGKPYGDISSYETRFENVDRSFMDNLRREMSENDNNR